MELPIYDAIIKGVEDGVVVMSLVNDPATLTNWLCFKEEKPISKFSVLDEEEHLLLGVVMVADTPIYRRNADGFEYFIKYGKETLKTMAEKMLKDGTFNNISINHNGEVLERNSVVLRELFIKDTDKGINPKGLESVPNGSLLASYKVENMELWEMCKNGTLNGFSLEGYFTTELVQNNKTKYNKMNRIKEALKKLLIEFGEVETDKGTLEFDGELLEVGAEVKTADGEAAEDGEYTTEDGTVYTVKDGVVTDVKEPQEEETTEEVVEETVEEVVAAEDEVEDVVEEVVEEETKEDDGDKIAELETEIETLKAEIETLKESVNELLNTPVVEPIAETFARVNNTEIRDEKLKRMCEVAKYLRK